MLIDTIRRAIEDRRVLRIYYDGGERVIEPHCLGRGRQGQQLLRAWQVSGYSRSRQPEAWKLFRVENIVDVGMTGDGFAGARPGYKPLSDRHIPVVVARL